MHSKYWRISQVIHLHHLLCSAMQTEKHAPAPYCMFNIKSLQMSAVLCSVWFSVSCWQVSKSQKLSPHVVAAGPTVISEIPETEENGVCLLGWLIQSFHSSLLSLKTNQNLEQSILKYFRKTIFMKLWEGCLILYGKKMIITWNIWPKRWNIICRVCL